MLERSHAVDGLGDEVDMVLDRLIDARLISVQRTTDIDNNAATLELAHESLVQTWTTLARWVDESREELTVLIELHDAAVRWQKHGARSEDLWAGSSLLEANLILSLNFMTGKSTLIATANGRIMRTAIHPDGSRIGLPLTSGEVIVVDLTTGAKKQFTGHTHEVNTFAFSYDGSLAGTVSDDGSVRVWDVDSGVPHWRGAALLHSLPSVVTHLGWQKLNDNPNEHQPGKWRDAIAKRGRYVAENKNSTLACVQTNDGFEMWNRESDTRVASRNEVVGGVRAVDNGCIA